MNWKISKQITENEKNKIEVELQLVKNKLGEKVNQIKIDTEIQLNLEKYNSDLTKEVEEKKHVVEELINMNQNEKLELENPNKDRDKKRICNENNLQVMNVQNAKIEEMYNSI